MKWILTSESETWKWAKQKTIKSHVSHSQAFIRSRIKKIVFAYNYTICGDGLKVQWNDYQASGDIPGSECIWIQYKFF